MLLKFFIQIYNISNLKKSALEFVLDEVKPDLIVLSERKLKHDELKFVTLNYYSVVTIDIFYHT
jgi:hypothetical protein